MILSFAEIQQKGAKSEAEGKRAVNALAREMGIVPSSEKVPKTPRPKEPPPDPSELESLLATKERLAYMARYVSRSEKKVQRKIEQIYKEEENKKKQEIKKEQDQEKLQSPLPKEPIIGGSCAGFKGGSEEKSEPEESIKENMGPETIKTELTRSKNDLVLSRRDPVLIMTKLYNPKTGVTVYPDTSLIGPKGFQVTWRGITNVIVLAFGMAMPLSRIEKLFGTKGFSRANTSNYCAYVAKRLAEVYVAMGKELSNCDVLMGDDCVSRVSDLTRYRRNLKAWQKKQQKEEDPEKWVLENPEPPKPWEALSEDSLSKQLEEELDFEFACLKADEINLKTQLHTTVLSGETTLGDPHSRVILYRSHLGSVGNLLDRLLLCRCQKKKDLVFVGDLSPTNRARNKEVFKHINITYGGCTSHARRPFKRYQDNDEENCLEALDFFRALYHIEDIIADSDASFKEKIRSDTVNGSMSFWNDLKILCESMLDKWSPATSLGEGIRYVLSHFEQLTLYCRDPRLPLSNDLSERLLRFEKLMDRSSFGRETIEGRARYDVIRSFYQSSLCTGIDPAFALLEVLITPSEIVSASPKKYTPQAISLRLKNDPERMALLNTILTTAKFSPLIKYIKTDPNGPVEDNPI